MRYLLKPFLAMMVLMLMQQPGLAADTTNQQQHVAAIQQVLHNYIEGTSYNNRPQIAKAFHPDADLLLDKEGLAFNKVPVADYLGWYKPASQGKFNGRIGEILQIDVSGTVATAKVEIIIPNQQARFIDVFLLKNVDNQWQIITKSNTKHDL